MRASGNDRVICDKCPICEGPIGPVKLQSNGHGIASFNRFQMPTSHRQCFGGAPSGAFTRPGPCKLTLTQKVKDTLGTVIATHSHIVELRLFSE